MHAKTTRKIDAHTNNSNTQHRKTHTHTKKKNLLKEPMIAVQLILVASGLSRFQVKTKPTSNDAWALLYFEPFLACVPSVSPALD